MGLQEDFLFWSMVKKLSVQYGYRIITLTEDHHEIWLESDKEKNFPVIRLMRYDLDWGNWLKRDTERTAANGEKIRKKLYKSRPLKVLSVYVTAYPPVDEYEYYINKPIIFSKTTIQSFILATSSLAANKESLEQILQKPLEIEMPDSEELEETQVAYLKQTAMDESMKKAKQEQEIFQQGKPIFTYLFMALQILVFVAMEFVGSSQSTMTLIQFGAKFSPLIMQGEWWRFFAPVVIHIGAMHLLMNTLSLFYLGTAVERIFGSSRFLLIYLFSGFAGVLGSFLVSSSVSAGASGAIFGCFGALLYFGIVNPKLFYRTMGSSVIIMLIINLVFGFSVSGVDNAAHIGGLIGGFAASAVVNLPAKKSIVRQLVFFAGVAASVFFLMQWGYSHQEKNGDDLTVAALAEMYVEDGQDEKAYEMLEAYKDDYKKAPHVYFLLGNREYQEGNIEAAEEAYLKAVEQKTDFHQAHFNLGLIYLDQNMIEKAEAQIQKAVDLEPNQENYETLLNEIKIGNYNF